MTLDPATETYLRELAAAGATPYEQMDSAQQAREAYQQVVAARMAGQPVPWPACSVEHLDAGGFWIKAYRPLGRSVYDPPLPLIVFFHGGGWVVGDYDTHDVHARALASTPAIVFSVNYRLAPEHPYPAAHEDALKAVTFADEVMGLGFNADRIAVAGDSAGGLLAAAVAVACREGRGPSLAGQCLIYPAMEPEMGSASHDELADGFGLTAASMRWFYDACAPGPGFSPSELADLSGLPPAVVATAGYDLLKDDGLRYGDRLRDAGVATTSLHFPGLIHGFFGMSGSSLAARSAIEATVGAFRGILAQS